MLKSILTRLFKISSGFDFVVLKKKKSEFLPLGFFQRAVLPGVLGHFHAPVPSRAACSGAGVASDRGRCAIYWCLAASRTMPPASRRVPLASLSFAALVPTSPAATLLSPRALDRGSRAVATSFFPTSGPSTRRDVGSCASQVSHGKPAVPARSFSSLSGALRAGSR